MSRTHGEGRHMCEGPLRGDLSSTLSMRPVSVGNNEEPLKPFILKSIYYDLSLNTMHNYNNYCQKNYKKLLQRTLLVEILNQKNKQKSRLSKFLDISKWQQDRAVAKFRSTTGYNCLCKPSNTIGIAQSPLCKLYDSNEEMVDHSFGTLASKPSTLDPCGANILGGETQNM
ncbi:hypothetical protein TNCV_583191 [Trichonephila clavipes]|nr:hypothetical protein TNCV_583191 [Trichonephila clavipes]